MKKVTSKIETLLFMGDSITDCGRRGANAPLGDGYVRMVSELFAIHQPQKALRFINKGIGGQTIVELQERWTDDVVHQEPDTLVMMIGINDLCRTVVQSPNAVPPARYEKLYDEVLARTRKELPRCRIVLMDPFYITRENVHTSIRHTVFTRLDEYIRVVHALSRRYRTELIPLHAMFQKLLRYRKPEEFCPEPVHPNHAGHLAIAEAVFAALKVR
jgi:lysophospholipase L1-like esterase